jgi:hypothetical protein
MPGCEHEPGRSTEGHQLRIPPPQTAPTMAPEKARQEIARTTRTGIPSEGASAILERIGLAE